MSDDLDKRGTKRKRVDAPTPGLGQVNATPPRRVKPKRVDGPIARPILPITQPPLEEAIARIEARALIDEGTLTINAVCGNSVAQPQPQANLPANLFFGGMPTPHLDLFVNFAADQLSRKSGDEHEEEMVDEDLVREDSEDEGDEKERDRRRAEQDERDIALIKKAEAAKLSGPPLTDEEKEELGNILIDSEDIPALTVDFLDIGMGDSTFFECDDGTTVMIDCGSVNSGALGAPVRDSLKFVAESLRASSNRRGLEQPTIDRFYITHCDRDHYNLLPSLFKTVKEATGQDLHVKQFFVTEDPKKYKQVNKFADEDKKSTLSPVEILTHAQKEGRLTQYKKEYAGGEAEALNENETVTIRTLCANSVASHGKAKNSNESATNMSSIVVMIEVVPMDEDGVRRKILMMGDAESAVENRLLALHSDAIEDSTILHVGHHGSQAAAQKPFVEKVNPQVAQVSADMKWQHPYDETVRRLVDNKDLRLNDVMENDPRHPYIVQDPTQKKHGHEIRTTASGFITNLTTLEDDTSGSGAALEATEKGFAPTIATGEQWRIVFSGKDGSYYKCTNVRSPDFDALF